MKTIISIWILLLCTGIAKVRAQNDPVLAGMILLYTDKAEKELKNQEKVMLMQTTGHIWTKEEVKGTTDLQREFNNYLNSFRSIVCYAAQIYGFYHEVSRLTDNLGDFTGQLNRHSTNALAVALSARKRHTHGLSLGQQDDGEGTHGNRIRHTSEVASHEQNAATTDQGGEIYLVG